MERIRIVIEVEVKAPTLHEKRELNMLVAHEAPQFVNEICSTVFGNEEEDYSFANAYVEDVEP